MAHWPPHAPVPTDDKFQGFDKVVLTETHGTALVPQLRVEYGYTT